MSELFSVSDGRYTIAHKIDDVMILETRQDVTPIIEANKIQVASATRKIDNVMTHVARIPYTVIDDLNQKKIMRGFMIEDERAFKQWLNDPDNRVWRTYPGSV
jgi:hypothetical protein